MTGISDRTRSWPVRGARGLVMALIVVWTLFPIYYMLTLSFTKTSELFRPEYFVANPTLESYRFIVFQESVFVKFFWRWMGNSVVVAGITMLIVLGVSALGSFALGRIRFGGARFISGMTLFTYIIPASFLCIPFFKIVGDYNLLDSNWSLIAAMTTFASPYALWVLWDYSKTIPPEIDESAAIDGAGVFAIFWRIYLPLILPVLIAIGTYAFFFAWNEYLYAVLFLQSEEKFTLPISMGTFLTGDDAPWNLLMAISTVYAIPPVIFYYVFRRYLTHGLVSGAVQGV
ncbi:MAG: carbohydrate ABC transporter permease [Candidatus Rokuibacteriota bacterium]